MLRDVDLDVPAPGITVLLGPSGSGKTTLLRSLGRLNELHEGCVTTGSVRVRLDGAWREVYAPGIDLPALRRRLAMVFQSPNVLPMSIEKNLALPLRLTLGLRGPALRERIERALADAELFGEVKDRLRERATTLSGGQQQRLCLARALALEPAVLLLDEPTASLDPKTGRRIEDLVRRLGTRYAVLAVSHGLGQAARLADRALVLREGRIVERLAGEDLHDPARLQRLVEEVF